MSLCQNVRQLQWIVLTVVLWLHLTSQEKVCYPHCQKIQPWDKNGPGNITTECSTNYTLDTSSSYCRPDCCLEIRTYPLGATNATGYVNVNNMRTGEQISWPITDDGRYMVKLNASTCSLYDKMYRDWSKEIELARVLNNWKNDDANFGVIAVDVACGGQSKPSYAPFITVWTLGVGERGGRADPNGYFVYFYGCVDGPASNFTYDTSTASANTTDNTSTKSSTTTTSKFASTSTTATPTTTKKSSNTGTIIAAAVCSVVGVIIIIIVIVVVWKTRCRCCKRQTTATQVPVQRHQVVSTYSPNPNYRLDQLNGNPVNSSDQKFSVPKRDHEDIDAAELSMFAQPRNDQGKGSEPRVEYFNSTNPTSEVRDPTEVSPYLSVSGSAEPTDVANVPTAESDDKLDEGDVPDTLIGAPGSDKPTTKPDYNNIPTAGDLEGNADVADVEGDTI